MDTDANNPNDIELFRRVIRAEGPMMTGDVDVWRRAIQTLAGRFGELTDPVIRVATDGDNMFVWFHAGEADVVWGADPDDDTMNEALEEMPYTVEPVSMADFFEAALHTNKAERLGPEVDNAAP